MELFPIQASERKAQRFPAVQKLPRMRNLPPGLTPAQKRIYKLMRINEGSVLKLHMKKNRTRCYRMIDIKKNAVSNFRYAVVRRMVNKEVLNEVEKNVYEILIQK